MHQPSDDTTRQLAARIKVIEERWAYLERTVEALDEVLRQVQDRLDRLDRRVEVASAQLRLLGSSNAEKISDEEVE